MTTDIPDGVLDLVHAATDRAGLGVTREQVAIDAARGTWYTDLARQAYALGLSRDAATVEQLCQVAIDDWQRECERLKAQRDAARDVTTRRDAHIDELRQHLATHTAERNALAIEVAALRIQRDEATAKLERIAESTGHPCDRHCDEGGCDFEAYAAIDRIKVILGLEEEDDDQLLEEHDRPVETLHAPALAAEPGPWRWELRTRTNYYPCEWEIRSSSDLAAGNDPQHLARLIADQHLEDRPAELRDTPWQVLVWRADETNPTPSTAVARVTSSGMVLARALGDRGLASILQPGTNLVRRDLLQEMRTGGATQTRRCTCTTEHVHLPSASGEDGETVGVVDPACPVHVTSPAGA